MSSTADAIGAWLARWVGGVLAWPKLVTTATLLAGGLAVYYTAGHLGVNTDTANMISATLPWRQHFNEYRDAFPARDRNLLIVIDAASPAAADAFAAALLGELRAEPELYRAILLPGEASSSSATACCTSRGELALLVDRMAQRTCSDCCKRFDGVAVLEVATRTLTQAPSGDAAALAPFYAELAQSNTTAAAGAPAPLAWNSLIAAGAAPTARRIVVLQPALAFDQLQPATAAIAGIRAAAARLNGAQAEPVNVRLTGSVAMEHEELVSVSRGAGIGALATLVMVALVLYAALRSWRLLVISLVTLLVGFARRHSPPSPWAT
jgi:hypothetical protein